MLVINPQLETPQENIYFYAVKADGTFDETPLAGPITVEAYTSKKAITLDTTKADSMPEGVNTIKVIVGEDPDNGKVLAEFTIEKHTDEIEKAKIVAPKGARPGSTGETAGSVSFDIQSESKIVEAYYVVETEESTPDVADFKDENGNYTGVIPVTDNKVTSAPIKLDTSDQEYYVYFLLKDEYGSISTAVCNGSSSEVYALIPSATYENNAKTVTKVEMPVLEDETDIEAAKVTITTAEDMETGDKFKAVLYKDNKPFAEAEIDGTDGGKTVQKELSEFKLIEDGSSNVEELEAGEYYVTVFGEGSADTAPSATTKSNVVTVSPIASVSDVEYTRYSEDGDDHTKLYWKTPHDKLDIPYDGGYDVTVAAYDQTAKDYEDFEDGTLIESVTVTENPEDPKVGEVIDPTEIEENTLYKAQVVVNVQENHKLSEADSLPTVSKEFFKLETPTVISNKSTSSEATLEIQSVSSTTKKDNTISGKVPTYAVEVYTKNPNYTASAKTEPEYIRASQYDQAVEVNKSSGRFTITGLDGNTEYAVKLVATVDGVDGKVKGESDFVSLGTKKAMIDITDKVVTEDADTRGGKIKASGTTVSIDGVDYDTTKYVELSKVAAIVEGLAEGDHITYSAEKPNEVSITIATTDNTANPRELPEESEGMIVNITSNGYDQKITTADETKVPAEINVTGQKTGTIDISEANAKDGRIVITNAKVKAASEQKVVVAAGSTVEFDGYYTVKASVETPVTVDSATIDITKTDSNNLSVTGFESGLTATVSGTGTQNGTMTFDGKGNVTVTPSGVTVASDITVKTVDADVTMNDENLTGHQNITVTYTSVMTKLVKAHAKEVAPFDMTNLDIKEYDYNNQADHNALIAAIDDVKVETEKGSATVEDVEATKANFDLVNAYLASFGLTKTDNSGKSVAKAGAQITVNKDEKSITITFTKDTKDANSVAQPLTIEGLR